MRNWAQRLRQIGEVTTLDYPYRLAGRKSPDPLPRLIAAHRQAIEQIRPNLSGPLVLIGKSMGGRIGCYASDEPEVAAVVCLGYPLCALGDPTKMRNKVLLGLTKPALFVQGTRDRLCPLELLASVRAEIRVSNHLYVVEDGDHSLLLTKTSLKQMGKTQAEIDDQILQAIGTFLQTEVGS
ncbi:MAG: alpha/beta hydrolase [Verrucomicrobia bacterium]|nr:alpha/beta hydrolase [Verrucomicrobiota bacterium]